MTPLEEIRRLYFKTTKQSILDDFDKAVDLLKSIESVEERQKATVYMTGLAEMRKEWGLKRRGNTKRTGSLRARKRPQGPDE